MDAKDLARHLSDGLTARGAAGDDCDWFALPDDQMKVLADAGYAVRIKVGTEGNERTVVKLTGTGLNAAGVKAPGRGRGSGIDNSYYKLHGGAEPCGDLNDGWKCLARKGHSGNHEGYFESGESGKSWANKTDVLDNRYYKEYPGGSKCGVKDGAWQCLAAEGHSGDHMGYCSKKADGTWNAAHRWHNEAGAVRSRVPGPEGARGSEYWRSVPGGKPCGEAEPDRGGGVCLAWKGHGGEHVLYGDGRRVVRTWRGGGVAGSPYYKEMRGGVACYEGSPDGTRTCFAAEGHSGDHVAFKSDGTVRFTWARAGAGEWDGGNEYYGGKGEPCQHGGPKPALCNCRKGHAGTHRKWVTYSRFELEWGDDGKSLPGNGKWKGRAALRCGGVLMVEGGRGYYICGAREGHSGAHHSYGGGDEREWTDAEAADGDRDLKALEVLAGAAAEGGGGAAEGAVSNEYAGDRDAACGEQIMGDDERLKGQRGWGKAGDRWTCLAKAGHTGTHRAYNITGKDCWGNAVTGYGWCAEWPDGAAVAVAGVGNGYEKVASKRCLVKCPASHGATVCYARAGHAGAHRDYWAAGGWSNEWSDGDGEGGGGNEYEADRDLRCRVKSPVAGGGACWARKGHKGAHRSYTAPGRFTMEWADDADDGVLQYYERDGSERCKNPREGGVTGLCCLRAGHPGDHAETAGGGTSVLRRWAAAAGDRAAGQLKYYSGMVPGKVCEAVKPGGHAGDYCTLVAGHPGDHVRTADSGKRVRLQWPADDGEWGAVQLQLKYYSGMVGCCRAERPGGGGEVCTLVAGHPGVHVRTADNGGRVQSYW